MKSYEKELSKYYIVKEGFYHDSRIKPDVDIFSVGFDTKELALESAENFCSEEAALLNRTKVKGGLNFTSGESGIEKYDYVTLAWDGVDYRVVTGYTVCDGYAIMKEYNDDDGKN